jgi:hypothetical protein
MGTKVETTVDDWLYKEAIEPRPKGTSEASRVRELIIKGFQSDKKD